MISGHEDQDHLRISIRKLVKIFKVFDGFPISSKITIKTPDIDALQDVTMRGIQVIFQSECSQISFEILQPICFDYFIVTEGEWSIHLEALKDVLAILDPNLITAPSSAVQRGHIDHFFARATPSHELCHIHLDVEDSIFALEMKNTQDGLISKCKLALHTPIPLQDFEFSFSVDTKAVSFSLKSSLLVNAFTSIDDTCKFIEITIDRSASSKVTLKCDGMAGESIFSYSGAALSNFQSDVDNWSIDRENVQTRPACYSLSSTNTFYFHILGNFFHLLFVKV